MTDLHDHEKTTTPQPQPRPSGLRRIGSTASLHVAGTCDSEGRPLIRIEKAQDEFFFAAAVSFPREEVEPLARLLLLGVVNESPSRQDAGAETGRSQPGAGAVASPSPVRTLLEQAVEHVDAIVNAERRVIAARIQSLQLAALKAPAPASDPDGMRSLLEALRVGLRDLVAELCR